VNQFLNEAQFESYRHLRSRVVDTITREQIDPKKTSMQPFLELARNYNANCLSGGTALAVSQSAEPSLAKGCAARYVLKSAISAAS